MPSLKEIKGRIASVNSTRKITSAMKMVASSKLHHAQVAIQNMLPYETLLEHILKSFLAAEAGAQTIYDQERPVKRVALVVFSSNSSLCGGFNANVIRIMLHAVQELSDAIGPENVDIYPVGRKVAEKAQKMGFNVKGDYCELVDKPNVKQCIDLAMELGRRFADGEVDRVELIYHHFKSAGSQILTHKTFLPIDVESELERDHERDLSSTVITKKAQDYLKRNRRKRDVREDEVKPLNDNFIVEPDMTTVLTKLLPKLAHLMIYTALLDSVASEHAARMVAMQTATDNADELLRQLNLQYNKSRQQAITSELLDIVGGSVNN
ncbi:F0F1 ATP synthase subunit gamma [Prevotella sp. E15-22]|uniref:F0F1 ATP synthase subunit gamma n=1 Tax=Prevotella sp. E15-22 TaxID=2937774 RepID=UPI00204690FD|nr:F0F1 ATP synthase subunit gamma [Prevotella sp. E15-22]UPS45715.1 F0F1 ATP synthase subunit gamma [Prevotella sp. E15-22]